MDRDLVSLGNQKVDGFPGIREGLNLSNQIIPEAITIGNVRLAESGAVPNKFRRNQLVKALPVLVIHRLNKLPHHLLVGLCCHG